MSYKLHIPIKSQFYDFSVHDVCWMNIKEFSKKESRYQHVMHEALELGPYKAAALGKCGKLVKSFKTTRCQELRIKLQFMNPTQEILRDTLIIHSGF